MHGPTCIVWANLTVTPFSLQYLLAKKVPKNIRVRVISFYNTLWTGNAVYDEQEILDMLPPAIRRQVISHMYKEMIDSVRLFNNLRGENRDEILCKICLGLQHTVALQGDFIMHEGETGAVRLTASHSI
jgi:hypothetical protein